MAEKGTALREAAKSGQLAQVEALLADRTGLDINFQDKVRPALRRPTPLSADILSLLNLHSTHPYALQLFWNGYLPHSY
jgi:hypothetical protein